uniref:Uncharacterized protein n=1 Tax=virus sp. ctBM815 TaxID=2825806 RepID=A0A8S5RKG9_9VIRU|nr:MAG TPA: hypothetical protein [virus sp. ctBM815]
MSVAYLLITSLFFSPSAFNDSLILPIILSLFLLT